MQVPSEVGTKLTGAVVVVIGRRVGSLGDREVGDYSVGVCSRMVTEAHPVAAPIVGDPGDPDDPVGWHVQVVPQRERRCCAGGVQDAGLVTTVTAEGPVNRTET
jgi:hypothetical protein